MTIGTDPNNRAVTIDLPRLIETRMLVQANSGAGKSWTLRRILEQTHGKSQQIVLDAEDEFYTLREQYDYVLAGRHGGDCPADVRSAALLARRLLELGVSAIVGIYELKFHDKIRFVKLFLDSLVSAPRDLWHPCLIVVDEAHIFAPQTGQAESSSAVIDLMTRGRKRGFCGIIATQRISKLHKDAAAEANNKLIGRSSLDVDMKRGADELGFSSREDMLSLRNLADGEFYAFGPAISPVVTRCKVGPVETTHPKAGQRAAPPPPAKDKVQKVLSQLADLPKEAEQEQATKIELQKQVRELKARIAEAETASYKQAVAAPLAPEVLKREFERGAQSVKRGLATELRLCAKTAAAIQPATLAALRDVAAAVARALAHVEQLKAPAMPSLEDIIEQVKAEPVRAPMAMAAGVGRPQVAPAPRPTRQPREAAENNGDKPKAGLRRMLIALAQRNGLSTRQVGVRACISSKSGTFGTYLSKARTHGWIAGDKHKLEITAEGLAALGEFDPLPTGKPLLEFWAGELEGGASRMLRALADVYPKTITAEELGEAALISSASGTFGTYLSRLRTLELVTGRKDELRASEELFE